MRIFFILICLAVFTGQGLAQFGSGEAEMHGCGTDKHHAFLMKTDPAYKASFLQHKALLDSVKRAPAAERTSPPVYTIPVVVHVIHLGEEIGYQSNISDEQIYGAIQGLNERYANVNGVGQDIEINFCLASRDPDGCPTSGIVRVDGSVVPGYKEEGITWDGNCGVPERPIKDLSKWPTSEYYNIWVVHDICGSIAGYAYYPNGNEYDGTVIDVASMRYGNLTLAHELGHGLNLKHTFSGDDDGDCPVNDDCLEDGDEICDTPPHRTGDCGVINVCSGEGVWTNSIYNYMSYCFPAAENALFTPDQRIRMRDAMTVEPRSLLLESEGCANGTPMRITSNAGLLCPFESRALTAQPSGGYFQIASGDGYIDGDTLFATGGSTIRVEYVLEDSVCVSSVAQDIRIKVVPNSLLRSAEDSLCIGQVTKLQGFPSGGVYSVISGPGLLDSVFLMAEDSGMIRLLYEKMYSGCLLRDTHVVSSFVLPEALISMVASDWLTTAADASSYQWVACDEDYANIPGATSPDFHAISSGSYAVITYNGVCRDTSECLTVEVTATRDHDRATGIHFYPNPAQDYLVVENESAADHMEISLSDVSGHRYVLPFQETARNTKLDLSGLPAGIYFLQIESAGRAKSVYKIARL